MGGSRQLGINKLRVRFFTFGGSAEPEEALLDEAFGAGSKAVDASGGAVVGGQGGRGDECEGGAAGVSAGGLPAGSVEASEEGLEVLAPCAVVDGAGDEGAEGGVLARSGDGIGAAAGGGVPIGGQAAEGGGEAPAEGIGGGAGLSLRRDGTAGAGAVGA